MTVQRRCLHASLSPLGLPWLGLAWLGLFSQTGICGFSIIRQESLTECVSPPSGTSEVFHSLPALSLVWPGTEVLEALVSIGFSWH
mmetsp:Transcript_31030/g.55559  ORF Transcript_31030/g.55559 Transcript_31030/m.55559 type:complete len:86 (+) Transcript_31030:338-595(+)